MPPLALLFPGLPANTVEPLPGWRAPALRAVDWATGAASGPSSETSGGPWSLYVRLAHDYLDAADAAYVARRVLDEVDWSQPNAGDRGIEIATLREVDREIGRIRETGDLLKRARLDWSQPDDPAAFLADYEGRGDDSDTADG